MYSSNKGTKGASVALVIIALVFICMHSCLRVTTKATYNVVVTDKAVKRIDDDDRYLIYTELINTGEVRVFQITDSYSRMRFNSADMYAKIKVGKSYRFEVYGMREELLSNYENIIAIEEITPTAPTETVTESQTETDT